MVRWLFLKWHHMFLLVCSLFQLDVMLLEYLFGVFLQLNCFVIQLIIDLLWPDVWLPIYFLAFHWIVAWSQ